jgi:hypothetical protein
MGSPNRVTSVFSDVTSVFSTEFPPESPQTPSGEEAQFSRIPSFEAWSKTQPSFQQASTTLLLTTRRLLPHSKSRTRRRILRLSVGVQGLPSVVSLLAFPSVNTIAARQAKKKLASSISDPLLQQPNRNHPARLPGKGTRRNWLPSGMRRTKMRRRRYL